MFPIKTSSRRLAWAVLVLSLAPLALTGCGGSSATSPSGPSSPLAATSYVYKTQFGTQGTGNGQLGFGAISIAVGQNNNIYVNDGTNSRVEVFKPDGTYLTQFGSHGSGNGQLMAPLQLTVDGQGNTYVCDLFDARVEVFKPDGTYLTQFDSTGTDGVAVDASGNVYIADSVNNRIEVFKGDGTLLRQFTTQTTANGTVNRPYQNIALDGAGDLYVTLGGSNTQNNVVARFRVDGTYVGLLAPSGTATGQLNAPGAVTVDEAGNVYVCDGTVKKFKSDGTYVTQFGFFVDQNALAVDASGNVYVSNTQSRSVEVYSPAQ